MSEARILSFNEALRSREAGRPPVLDLDGLRQRQGMIGVGSYHAAIHNVTVIKKMKTREVEYFNDFSLAIPRGRKIALLGHRDLGSRQMLELLTQRLAPNKGSVVIESRISWIIPDVRFLDKGAPLRENASFFARIIGMDPQEMLAMMLAMGELPPKAIFEPIKNLPPWAVKRLGLVILYFCNFDLHLVGRFQTKSMKLEGDDAVEVLNLVYGRDYVAACEDGKTIPQNCNLLYVLYEGVLYEFEDIAEGVAVYDALPKPVEGPRVERDQDDDSDEDDSLREEFF